MDALELLVGRESAMKLASPGPDQEALEKMFESALLAPDHGRLRPWRFVVVPEEKRERFGDLMADCLRRAQPDAPDDMLQRERDKALRAPVIVVAAAAIQRGHKIPEVEQLVSAAGFDKLMEDKKPTLVIWQTGTVDAMRSIDPDDFRTAVDDGVAAMEKAGRNASTPIPSSAGQHRDAPRRSQISTARDQGNRERAWQDRGRAKR